MPAPCTLTMIYLSRRDVSGIADTSGNVWEPSPDPYAWQTNTAPADVGTIIVRYADGQTEQRLPTQYYAVLTTKRFGPDAFREAASA